MNRTERVRASGNRNKRPGLLLSLIVVPTLALLVFLIAWAYSARDWTWFALLLAASIGLVAFVAAPHLFSLSDRRDGQSVCVEMPSAHGLQEKVVERHSSAGIGASTASKAPDRSA